MEIQYDVWNTGQTDGAGLMWVNMSFQAPDEVWLDGSIHPGSSTSFFTIYSSAGHLAGTRIVAKQKSTYPGHYPAGTVVVITLSPAEATNADGVPVVAEVNLSNNTASGVIPVK